MTMFYLNILHMMYTYCMHLNKSVGCKVVTFLKLEMSHTLIVGQGNVVEYAFIEVNPLNVIVFSSHGNLVPMAMRGLNGII